MKPGDTLLHDQILDKIEEDGTTQTRSLDGACSTSLGYQEVPPGPESRLDPDSKRARQCSKYKLESNIS
jgi:hypothetical protein